MFWPVHVHILLNHQDDLQSVQELQQKKPLCKFIIIIMNKNHLLDDKYGFKSSFIRMAKCAKISKPLWATYFELLKKKELEIKNKI